VILYIHPKSGLMLTEILPISLPALINRLPLPVVGRFAHEVRRQEIRRARFILLDLHWYTSLANGVALSQRIRSINPHAVIIAGGISATLFARQILRDSCVDFIVRGDAEVPLPRLITTLDSGMDPRRVPNVVGKGFESSHRYSLTPEDFDASDFRRLSFFPTLEKRLYRLHEHSRGKPFPVYPYLMAFRGCPFDCSDCYGSPRLQKRLFGRTWVVRSAQRIRQDLEYWDSDDRIRFVNVYHDFVSLMPEDYSREVLARRFDLSVYYDFFQCPSAHQLELVVNAFEKGVLSFGLDDHHANSNHLVQLDELISRIRTALGTGRFKVRLTFNKSFIKADPAYADALRTVVRKTGVSVYNGEFWWENNPVPGSDGYGTGADYKRCLREGGRRYFGMNAVYRTGTLVHRYSPRLVALGARIWFKR